MLKMVQNCSKLFKSTYTCPQKSAQNCSKYLPTKSAQNCSKLLKKYLYLPKKSAQNCSKLLKKYLYLPKKSAQNCSKLLKIAQNGSKWLKIAQKCSKCLKMSQNAILRNFEVILRHFETYWDILGDRINTMHDNNVVRSITLYGVQVMIRR